MTSINVQQSPYTGDANILTMCETCHNKYGLNINKRLKSQSCFNKLIHVLSKDDRYHYKEITLLHIYNC